MLRFRTIAFSLAAACAAACTTTPAPPADWQAWHSAAPPAPPENAFPLPPERLEGLMRERDLELRGAELTRSGITGTLRMEAYYPAADRTLTIKWKPAPEGGAGWNNSPRREIAAYRIQKWFLEPRDYVVPTTLPTCIPFDAYPVEHDGDPTFPGTQCIFGTQAIWLEDVTTTKKLFDEWRFYRDPTYARHLGNYNLLTYLIQNRDARGSNVLVSRDETNRRVYSIDNGISLGTRLYNYFACHWDEIRVPALPRSAVDRLRRVTPAEVEALSVLAELRVDDAGILRETRPSPPFEPAKAVRVRDGVVQLGLVQGEIEGVRQRLHDLIRAVDAGEIPTF